LIGDIKSKQNNTLWPEAMVNARSVDKFLWWGLENPPLVQRIAAWLFGITFFGYCTDGSQLGGPGTCVDGDYVDCFCFDRREDLPKRISQEETSAELSHPVQNLRQTRDTTCDTPFPPAKWQGTPWV